MKIRPMGGFAIGHRGRGSSSGGGLRSGPRRSLGGAGVERTPLPKGKGARRRNIDGMPEGPTGFGGQPDSSE